MSQELKHIIAPNLTDSNYGENINEVFNNINENFTLLSNIDLYKGEQGDSINIVNINMSKDGDPDSINYKLYESLKTALTNQFDSLSELITSNGRKISWDYNINNYNVTISTIKNSITNVEKYLGSVTPTLFFDHRFDSRIIDSQNDLEVYNNIEDCTCIISFECDNDNNWKCNINTSFPTLKFQGGNFYWVLGNSKNTSSTIKATGAKGPKGDGTNIWLCHGKTIDSNSPDIILNNYIDINGNEQPFANNTTVGYVGKVGEPVFIFHEDTNNGYNGIILAFLNSFENGYWIAKKCSDIQDINYIKNTVEFFKSLGSSNDAAKGLFVLFNHTTNNDNAHLIYSNDKELVISPVQSYNDLNTVSGCKVTFGYDQVDINGDLNVNGTITATNINNVPDEFNTDIFFKKNIFVDEVIHGYNGLNVSTTNDLSTIKQDNNNIQLSVQDDSTNSITINNQYIEVSSASSTNTSKVNINPDNITLSLSDKNIKFEVVNDESVLSIDKVESVNGFYQTSDERLKEFKEDIQIDFEKLSKIPKKYFTWKLNNKKTEIGTSAQEIEQLYPELISKDVNGTLSVSYDKLSIVALKAIDELYKKNQELERRIKELENKIQ